jgi:hypothetical protein
MPRTSNQLLVVCIENDEYEASLEKRKIYVALNDSAAKKHGLVRVVDESGSDYFYPKKFFRLIALPRSIRQAILAAE